MQIQNAWPEKKLLKPWMWAGLIILTGTTLRLWMTATGQLDLVQDEAQYWDWSRRLQLSYYSKGPLISWMIALGTALCGDTVLGVRICALIGSACTQIFMYLSLARCLRRPALGVLLLFIANSTPLFMAGGLLMTTDNPLMLCWAAALYCLLSLQNPAGGQGHAANHADNRPFKEPLIPWLGLGLAICLGVLAKYTMLFLPCLALAHCLLLKRLGLLRSGYLRRLAAVIACGTAIGLLPIVLWNMQNDWVSLRHVARLAGVDTVLMAQGAQTGNVSGRFFRPDLWLEYIGGQVGLLLPWWFVFMLIGAWRALKNMLATLRACTRHAANRHGANRQEAQDQAQRSLLLLLFWPVWLYFLLWALFNRVYPNWPAMCYISGLFFAAESFAALWAKGQSPKSPRFTARRLAPLWLALSLMVFSLVQTQDFWGHALPERLNPAVRLKGWSDLGQRLEELRLASPNPDKVFFFSDAYDVTAELAFYAPGQPVAYCADFGRRRSQYDLWPGPQDKTGWDAIYVSRKPLKRMPGELAQMFESVSAPESYASEHRGGAGRSFGIVVLRNFNGFWPQSDKIYY